jgi:hypothetical protein
MTNRLIHSSSSTLNNNCKSLVVYMSPYSLGSTLKYERFTAKLRAMCEIPVHLHSLILGVLLSDGWLYKKKSGKTLLALKQNDFEYLWFVYTKLSHYCRSLPLVVTSKQRGKIYISYQFATRVYPCLNIWFKMFYPEGKKVVPLDLYDMLTYEALAHWIMGDGTRNYGGITLNSQSFTIQECVFIISILIYKFDLKCSLHMQRNQPTIYISSKSMKKLRPLILPYMCNSVLSKLEIYKKK